MKPRGRTVKEFSVNLFRLLLRTIVSSFLTVHLTAQTLTILHSFSAAKNNTNSDGIQPEASLVLSGNTLYGTAAYGGSLGNGTIFKVKTDGTDFTTLHSFAGGNVDGATPLRPLLLAGGNLYGTTALRGSAGGGTVFRINTDGTGYTNLHNFGDGADGWRPSCALVLSGPTLYGATTYGGSSETGLSLGAGTLFALNTNGTGYRVLYNFNYTNSDGVLPNGLVILSGRLFGTASHGGLSTYGTLFSLNIDGSDFARIYDFSDNFNGSSEPNPTASLILSGGTLYGMAEYGGRFGSGSLFALNTDGTGFRTVYEFNVAGGSSSTNSDGAGPVGGLLLSGDTLYGVTIGGGESAGGTVFQVQTDGSGFATLHSFAYDNDGFFPYGGLVLSGSTLYGTTYDGGVSSRGGTIFSISLPPRLTLRAVGPNLVLAWPTNFNGFTLQSATNLVSPTWTTHFPVPVVVNGQNTVTNPISGTHQFYRLSR